MPREPNRPFTRLTPPCAVDDDFMQRLASALKRERLSDNARLMIGLSVHFHNSAKRSLAAKKVQRRPRSGRPIDLNEHVFVEGLLEILESEDGVEVRVSKRARDVPGGGQRRHANGKVADFLRVIWDALEHPSRDADSFARLAANCLRVTMAERKERRARRRAPRQKYIEGERQAWKR